jgi:hypothetical protein
VAALLLSSRSRGHSNGGFTLIELLIVVGSSGHCRRYPVIWLARARQSDNEAPALGHPKCGGYVQCFGGEFRRDVSRGGRSVDRGATGTRSFGSDRRGTIYYSGAASIPNPIPAGLDYVQ